MSHTERTDQRQMSSQEQPTSNQQRRNGRQIPQQNSNNQPQSQQSQGLHHGFSQRRFNRGRGRGTHPSNARLNIGGPGSIGRLPRRNGRAPWMPNTSNNDSGNNNSDGNDGNDGINSGDDGNDSNDGTDSGNNGNDSGNSGNSRSNRSNGRNNRQREKKEKQEKKMTRSAAILSYLPAISSDDVRTASQLKALGIRYMSLNIDINPHAFGAALRINALKKAFLIFDKFYPKDNIVVEDVYGSDRTKKLAEYVNSKSDLKFEVIITGSPMAPEDVNRRLQPSSPISAHNATFHNKYVTLFHNVYVEGPHSRPLTPQYISSKIIGDGVAVWLGHDLTATYGATPAGDCWIRTDTVKYYADKHSPPYTHKFPDWLMTSGTTKVSDESYFWRSERQPFGGVMTIFRQTPGPIYGPSIKPEDPIITFETKSPSFMEALWNSATGMTMTPFYQWYSGNQTMQAHKVIANSVAGQRMSRPAQQYTYSSVSREVIALLQETWGRAGYSNFESRFPHELNSLITGTSSYAMLLITQHTPHLYHNVQEHNEAVKLGFTMKWKDIMQSIPNFLKYLAAGYLFYKLIPTRAVRGSASVTKEQLKTLWRKIGGKMASALSYKINPPKFISRPFIKLLKLITYLCRNFPTIPSEYVALCIYIPIIEETIKSFSWAGPTMFVVETIGNLYNLGYVSIFATIARFFLHVVLPFVLPLPVRIVVHGLYNMLCVAAGDFVYHTHPTNVKGGNVPVPTVAVTASSLGFLSKFAKLLIAAVLLLLIYYRRPTSSSKVNLRDSCYPYYQYPLDQLKDAAPNDVKREVVEISLAGKDNQLPRLAVPFLDEPKSQDRYLKVTPPFTPPPEEPTFSMRSPLHYFLWFVPGYASDPKSAHMAQIMTTERITLEKPRPSGFENKDVEQTKDEWKERWLSAFYSAFMIPIEQLKPDEQCRIFPIKEGHVNCMPVEKFYGVHTSINEEAAFAHVLTRITPKKKRKYLAGRQRFEDKTMFEEDMSRMDTFQKSNEVLFKRSNAFRENMDVMSTQRNLVFKPRMIINVPASVIAATIGETSVVTERMADVFNADMGGYYDHQLFRMYFLFASGTSQAELSYALENFRHESLSIDKPCFLDMGCGDDAWMYTDDPDFIELNGGDTVVSDASSCDTFTNIGALSIERIINRVFGMSNEVSNILYQSTHTKLVVKDHEGQHKIDLSKSPNRLSGHSNTKLGNYQVLQLYRLSCIQTYYMSGLYKGRMEDNPIYHGHTLPIFETVPRHYIDVASEVARFLGMKMKISVVEFYHSDFLRMRPSPTINGPDIFVPTESLLLKFGKCQHSPLSIFKIPKTLSNRYQIAADQFMISLAKGWNSYVLPPLFRALIQKYLDGEVKYDRLGQTDFEKKAEYRIQGSNKNMCHDPSIEMQAISSRDFSARHEFSKRWSTFVLDDDYVIDIYAAMTNVPREDILQCKTMLETAPWYAKITHEFLLILSDEYS